MNEDQKQARVEMECLAQEAKVMKEAKIKRLKEAPLLERMQYIIASNPDKQDYSAVEMTDALAQENLLPPMQTVIDIADFMRENLRKV